MALLKDSKDFYPHYLLPDIKNKKAIPRRTTMIQVEKIWSKPIPGKGTETRYKASYQGTTGNSPFVFDSILGINSAVKNCKHNLIQNLCVKTGIKNACRVASKALEMGPTEIALYSKEITSPVHNKIVAILDLKHELI